MFDGDVSNYIKDGLAISLIASAGFRFWTAIKQEDERQEREKKVQEAIRRAQELLETENKWESYSGGRSYSCPLFSEKVVRPDILIEKNLIQSRFQRIDANLGILVKRIHLMDLISEIELNKIMALVYVVAAIAIQSIPTVRP